MELTCPLCLAREVLKPNRRGKPYWYCQFCGNYIFPRGSLGLVALIYHSGAVAFIGRVDWYRGMETLMQSGLPTALAERRELDCLCPFCATPGKIEYDKTRNPYFYCKSVCRNKAFLRGSLGVAGFMLLSGIVSMFGREAWHAEMTRHMAQAPAEEFASRKAPSQPQRKKKAKMAETPRMEVEDVVERSHGIDRR